MKKIRFVEEKDFKYIKALMQSVHNLHSKNRSDIYKDNDVFYKNEFMDIINSNNKNILVYEENYDIKGCLLYSIKQQGEDEYIYSRKYLYIDMIVVNKDEVRKNIGKELYFEAKRIAMENNCKSIDLNVWGFNKTAIEFYKKIGMSIKTIKFEDIL